MEIPKQTFSPEEELQPQEKQSQSQSLDQGFQRYSQINAECDKAFGDYFTVCKLSFHKSLILDSQASATLDQAFNNYHAAGQKYEQVSGQFYRLQWEDVHHNLIGDGSSQAKQDTDNNQPGYHQLAAQYDLLCELYSYASQQYFTSCESFVGKGITESTLSALRSLDEVFKSKCNLSYQSTQQKYDNATLAKYLANLHNVLTPNPSIIDSLNHGLKIYLDLRQIRIQSLEDYLQLRHQFCQSLYLDEIKKRTQSP